MNSRDPGFLGQSDSPHRIRLFRGRSVTTADTTCRARRPLANLAVVAFLLLCSVASGQSDVVLLYSHRDAAHKAAIEAHLSPLVRTGHVRLWSDQRIRPGADWHASVCQALDEADIAVLLVSSDFVASDFCWRESERALDLRSVTGLVVLPVVVRPFYGIERLPFGNLQSVVLADFSDSERSRVAAAIDSLVPTGKQRLTVQPRK